MTCHKVVTHKLVYVSFVFSVPLWFKKSPIIVPNFDESMVLLQHARMTTDDQKCGERWSSKEKNKTKKLLAYHKQLLQKII